MAIQDAPMLGMLRDAASLDGGANQRGSMLELLERAVAHRAADDPCWRAAQALLLYDVAAYQPRTAVAPVLDAIVRLVCALDEAETELVCDEMVTYAAGRRIERAYAQLGIALEECQTSIDARG